MKRKILIYLFLVIPVFLSAQTIFVDSFTTTQGDINQLMPGMTDVLRSAISANRSITLTTNRNAAEYLVTGSVTRFGIVRQDNFSGNNAAQMFDSINKITRSDNTAEMQINPGVMITAQVVHVRSGNILSSRTIQAVTWDEYQRKAEGLARALIEPIPPPAAAAAAVRPVVPTDALSGIWQATINHGNFEDTYRLTFSGGNRISVTVTSIDGSGTRRTQTTEENYTYQDDILNINVRFNNNTIQHLNRIEWRVMLVMADNRRSFNAVVPVSNAQNASRVRAVFHKQ
jgi:hypothetical protein